MKSTVTFTFLLLFCFCNFAQDSFNGTIRWGEPSTNEKKERGPYPIGVVGDHFYTTSYIMGFIKVKGEYLNSYNFESLALEKKSKLKLVDGKNKLEKKSNFQFGDKLLYITSYVDVEAKKERFLLHEILSDLTLGEGKLLVELDWQKTKKMALSQTAALKVMAGTNLFSVFPSSDKKSLMVWYAESMLDTDITTILFDEDLNEIARETWSNPYTGFVATSAQYGHDGYYYQLGYETHDEETAGVIKRTVKGKGDFHVLAYNPMDGEMDEFSLNIDKNIVSSGLRLMDDGSLTVYGMYAEEGETGVTGSFFERYAADGTLLFSEIIEFEEDFITQHWTEKEKKRTEEINTRKPEKAMEPALYNYILHGLAVKENGDVVLIAEQYYMNVTYSTTNVNGSAQTTTTYHYIFNDVITVNCTKEGAITWKNLIKKRQHSTNDGGRLSSFFTAVDGNELIFVYNDKESNMEDADEAVTRSEKKKAQRNSVAAFIRLTEDGEFERKTLFDFNGNEARTLVPRYCFKISEDEYLFYAETPNRGKILARVTLD